MKAIVGQNVTRKLSMSLVTAILLSAVLTNFPVTSLADDLVLEVVHVNVSSTELESIDVTKDGSFIVGAAPIAMVDLGNGKEGVQSEVPQILHASGSFIELPTVQVGPGEITDVVLGPNSSFMVINIRDDDLFDRNQLLLSRGHGVTHRVNLPDSADGIGLSPNGEYVVVAGEKYEAVDIYGFSTRGANIRLEFVTRIGRGAFDPFFEGEEARLENEDLEPESVTFTSDGSLAFVSLQEQSSVAVIDMASLSLVNVVHLPFGFLVDESDEGDEPSFAAFGVEPDGMSVSPDGSFLVTANEASGDAPHLGGVSIVDLRNGATDIPEAVTHCIFDIDPGLLDDSGVASCPQLAPGQEPTAEETEAIRALPRLDPNNTETIERDGTALTAINIERPPEDEDRGSVLFVDMAGALEGSLPAALCRVNVGVGEGARPEAIKSTNDGLFFWINLQQDGGTIARIELVE